jgi:hypothetical protein
MSKLQFNDTLSESEEEVYLINLNSDELKPKATSSDNILIRFYLN